METTAVFEIRVKGILNEQWSDWFSGLTLACEPDGTMVLTGPLPDQAALFGVLNRLNNLNLAILSFRQLACEARQP
jgi:hypothetical protein